MITWSMKDDASCFPSNIKQGISIMMEEAKNNKLPFIRIKLIKLGKQLKT